jgi:hypothetical protein
VPMRFECRLLVHRLIMHRHMLHNSVLDFYQIISYSLALLGRKSHYVNVRLQLLLQNHSELRMHNVARVTCC